MFQVPSKTIYDENNKIWRGSVREDLFKPNTSVGEAWLQVLDKNPDKIVQISERTGQKLTAGEMSWLGRRAAQHMDKLGYTEDDVIGLMANNTHFLAPLVLGALLHGVAFNALDPTLQIGEIMEMFNITKPKTVFCDASLYETVKNALHEINLPSPVYVLNGSFKGAPTVEEFFKSTGTESLYVPPKFAKGDEQIATIVFSSGTSGLPKGICLSHCCILRNSENTFPSDTILLCFSTLYWLSALSLLAIGIMCGGNRIITDRPFTPELMLELIEKYKISVIFSPPSDIALAIKCPDIKTRDLSSVKYYLCGGSSVPIPVYEGIQKYLKNGDIFVGYGMTEVGGSISVQNKMINRIGSVGQVGLNRKIKIINDNGKALGPEEKGEICIQTPYKNLGYYGRTDSITDGEGWIHSGDVGHFDSDGFLYITERKKEIFKYKNFQCSPTEIEMIIMKIPDVVEVCVFSIPDFTATDLPAAAIVKKKESNLSKDNVYNFVAEQMANYNRLRGGVYFLPSLPKTPSGKILRRTVKELFVNNPDLMDKWFG